jgi:Mce-associated membrane protein
MPIRDEEQMSQRTSATTERPGRAPWIVAGVLGVVTAALAVWLFGVILPNRGQDAEALSSNERAAVAAARTFVVNQFTYSRASFDSDFNRAVAGATGAARDDLVKNKANLLAAMTKGQFDLTGSVQDAAFVSADGSTVTVLVSATGYQVSASGQVPTSLSRFKITMTKSGSSWLASDLQSVGLV